MNKLLQDGLIGIYWLVKSTGAIEIASSRRGFEASYRLYKERLEAGPIRMLRSWVRSKTFVIDGGWPEVSLIKIDVQGAIDV